MVPFAGGTCGRRDAADDARGLLGAHAYTPMMALAHNDNAAITTVTFSAFTSTSQAERRCPGTLSTAVTTPQSLLSQATGTLQ